MLSIKDPALLVLKVNLLFLITSLSIRSSAQEMLGITNTKYNATHGAILNPALPVTSPFYLDFNLLTAHAFVQNNYIYIKKEEDKFNRFLKGELSSPNDNYYLDYYTPSLKNGYVNFRVLGPSATIVIGKNAFGISLALRSVTSFRNFPVQIAKFFYEGLYFPPQYDTRFDQNENISFGNLEWAEIGLNYSGILINQGLDMWTIGSTLKIIQGYAGAYAFSQHIDFEVPNYDTLIIYDADAEAGLSLPINYDNDEFQQAPLFRGAGAGIDLGIVYSRKKLTGKSDPDIRHLCAQQYYPYHWRVGFSVIDVGLIRFNKNAKKLNVENGSFEWPGINSNQYSSINGEITKLSDKFFNDPDQLVSDNKIRIGLPSAISLQGDYNFWGNWFVSAVGILPVRIFSASIIRPSLLSAGLRYENRLFQFGTTVTLDDLSKPHLGFNARISNFFFGSENLFSLLKTSDFTGTDIYAGIKLSLSKGRCRHSPGIECDFEEFKKFQHK